MKNEQLIKGLAVGFFAGTLVSSVIVRTFVKEWMAEDNRIAERNKAIFSHMIEALGPYAPAEVLEEVNTFVKFQSIVKEEKGRA